MVESEIQDITKPKKLIFTKEINGLWFADLEIEKNDKIQEECYIEFLKILFIAKKINEIKDKNGKLISRIKIDHLMTELNDFGIGPFEYTGVSPTTALTNVLSGTTWSVGTVDIGGTGDVKSDKRITVLAAINLIAKEFDGEIDYICNKSNSTFTRIVDIKSQIGTVTKLLIRYDKSSDYIRREKDTTKLITRLYVYGKDDITIESVNPTGKAYLDSPNIGDYKNIKEDVLYTNISDKTVLMNYGQAYLDIYDSKILRYKINTWDLTIIPHWADEVINLGDTLRVQDNDLNLNVDVRVKKIIKDLTDPRHQTIELADKFKTIVEPISNLEQIIDNVTFDNDYRSMDFRDGVLAEGINPYCYYFIIDGLLEISAYQGPVLEVYRDFTAKKLVAYVSEPQPGGVTDTVTIDVYRTGSPIGSVSITTGNQRGEADIDVDLIKGDLLNLGISAVDGAAELLALAVRSE